MDILEKRSAEARRRRSRLSTAFRRGDLDVGTFINVAFAVIVLGLIGYGVWWVIKTFGEAGQQYTGAMVETRYTALTVKCQTNLRAIGQNIQMYAISNEQFPPSTQELIDFGGNTRLFQCPDPNGSKYVYIPGQSGDMLGANILVYEPKAVHDGRCGVLTLGGQIGLLKPEELQAALAATRAAMAPRRR
ncbi:MAG: hypothetical protein JSU70_12910 [Phycisphaerales bacterium]|nr:MAG: hypothetical protein JSU70_12910 [Phycisphaerales bacterium]